MTFDLQLIRKFHESCFLNLRFLDYLMGNLLLFFIPQIFAEKVRWKERLELLSFDFLVTKINNF